MPAYQEITDAELASGKPGTQSLLTRLRDNAIAIAEGDPSAPRIQQAAFQTSELNFYHFGESQTNKTVSTVETWRGGEYRFNNLTVSGAGEIRCSGTYTVIRVNGLLTLQGTITADGDYQLSDKTGLTLVGGAGGDAEGVGTTSNPQKTFTTINAGDNANFSRSMPFILSGMAVGGGNGAWIRNREEYAGDYSTSSSAVGLGGGAIYIMARSINFTGYVTARGGDFGDETHTYEGNAPPPFWPSVGTSGGGGGGLVVIAYATLVNNAGSVAVHGGENGSNDAGGNGLAAMINTQTGSVTSI